MSMSINPLPFTIAKSRTRRKSELDIRGVPRLRKAISQPPRRKCPSVEGRLNASQSFSAPHGRSIPDGSLCRNGHAAEPSTGRFASWLDQSERLKGQLHALRPRLIEKDVDAVILHGGIKILLHDGVQAMDLVDEKHVVVSGLMRMPARSPGLSSTGLDVTLNPTPSSLATIFESVVFPGFGGHGEAYGREPRRAGGRPPRIRAGWI